MLKISGTKELLNKYSNLQLTKKKQKADEKVKWIVCNIDGSEIVEDCCMTKKQLKAYIDEEKKDKEMDDACHETFIAALQKTGEPRYGMMDYREKVFFVSHIPENAKRALKMTYATVRENFKDTLTGIGPAIQSTDAGDLAKEEFDGKIKDV